DRLDGDELSAPPPGRRRGRHGARLLPDRRGGPGAAEADRPEQRPRGARPGRAARGERVPPHSRAAEGRADRRLGLVPDHVPGALTGAPGAGGQSAFRPRRVSGLGRRLPPVPPETAPLLTSREAPTILGAVVEIASHCSREPCT